MVRRVAWVLVALCLASPAPAQTFLGLTLGAAPPEDRPTKTSEAFTRADETVSAADVAPNLCQHHWDLLGQRNIGGISRGCDGPLVSVLYDNGLFGNTTSGTYVKGFTFNRTTRADVITHFGSAGLKMGVYGAENLSVQYSLAYPIEGYNSAAVFHFATNRPDGTFDTTEHGRNTARLIALGMVDMAFLQAFDAGGRAPQRPVPPIQNPFDQ